MNGLLALMLLALLSACGKSLPPPAPCADLTQGCRIEKGSVEARVDRTPGALQPFVLTVRAPHAKQVYAEFVMQGMEMGLNRYRLKQAPNGEWGGRITLPVCVSGRRDWLLILDLDGERVAFAFAVN